MPQETSRIDEHGEVRPTEEFDLIIIGGGSGNSIPSPELGGLRIAIIDDGERFGGTCLNVGCIPTKMFVRPAELAREARTGEHLGLRNVHVDVDWAAVRDRTFGQIDPISEGGERYRAEGEPNISLVRETVRFVDRHVLETASGRRLRGERIVIAAGSRPRELEAAPFGDRIISNSEAMRLESCPERIVVIGGGAVGCEFAGIFSGFGAEVVQLVRSAPLREIDPEVSATFVAVADWDIRSGVEITGVREAGAGLEVELDDGTALTTDLVLVAVGRIPNTDRLGTREIGLDHHDDGRLVVDEYQRVLADGEPVDGLWALGDVESRHQLKHVANQGARIVLQNLVAELRSDGAEDADLVPNTLGPVPLAVFTTPEVAAFGLNEQQALDAGHDVIAVRHDYQWTAWGWALDDTTSFCRLVVDRQAGTLLGAQIIGRDAAILLQPLVQAASFGQSVHGLARGQYWPHPAATEIVENALLRAAEALEADARE